MPHIILHGVEITAINRPNPALPVAPLTGDEETEIGCADIVIRKHLGRFFKAGLFGRGSPHPLSWNRLNKPLLQRSKPTGRLIGSIDSIV